MPLPVETERLVLRVPRRDDAEAVFAIHGDPATNRHNPHGPHRSLAESRALLEEMIADWAGDGIGYFGVARREDPEAVIGFAGTRFKDLGGVRVLNLYYRFRPTAWGRGLAGEAARAALRFARAHSPDIPVVALVREDNLASIRLAERLGMARSPDLKDEEGRAVYVLASPRIRVAAYVIRYRSTPELLVFDHVGAPDAGTQVPAGGVEPGEALQDAVVREVAEETGLTGVRVIGAIATDERPHPETGRPRRTTFFHLMAPVDTADAWEHRVDGDGEDAGMVFACRFQPLPLSEELADTQDAWLNRLNSPA